MHVGNPTAIEEERELVARIFAGGPDSASAVEKLLLDLAQGAIEFLSGKYGISPEELLATLYQHLVTDDWRRLRQWNGSASLRTWLSVVTSRLCLDILRKEKRYYKKNQPLQSWAETSSSIELSDAEQSLDSKWTQQKFHEAMQKLSPLDQLIISLYYLEGCSIEELAKTLKTTVGNAHVKKTRAIKKITQILGGGESDAIP